jgi:prepilin-type N-terminal cleavage/methylation domain-containing protein
MQQPTDNRKAAGFTLPEVMVTVVIVGILAAAAIPNLGVFKGKSDLSQAQALLASGLRAAQTQAINQRRDWRASLRSNTATGRLELLTHASDATPNWASATPLASGISLASGTTLSSSSGIYDVQFDYQGNLGVSDQGRIIFQSAQASGQTSCVIISSLIGALRLEQNADCSG